MKGVIGVSVTVDTNLQVKEIVENECRKQHVSNILSKQEQPYYLLQSQSAQQRNILLCLASNIISHQAVDYLQTMFDVNCGSGHLRQCSVDQNQFQSINNSVRAILVRHPLDRLILEFKHSRSSSAASSDNVVKSRRILFSRHRNPVKKKHKKGSHLFRQFIKNSVLQPNSTIRPISQVINVNSNFCNNIMVFTNFIILSGLQCLFWKIWFVSQGWWWSQSTSQLVQPQQTSSNTVSQCLSWDEAQSIWSKVEEEILLRDYCWWDGTFGG